MAHAGLPYLIVNCLCGIVIHKSANMIGNICERHNTDISERVTAITIICQQHMSDALGTVAVFQMVCQWHISGALDIGNLVRIWKFTESITINCTEKSLTFLDIHFDGSNTAYCDNVGKYRPTRLSSVHISYPEM